MTWKSTTAAAVVCMLTQTNAKIKADGLWDNNDWYDSALEIGVTKGVPYGKNEVKRRMDAAMALEGTVADYATKANVIRVKSVFPETCSDASATNTVTQCWEHVFSQRKSLYTYEGFLNAVGKFPAFCGEHKLKKAGGTAWSDDDACRRELATLFAHFNQETGGNDPTNQWTPEGLEEWRQGLMHITEYQCTAPNGKNAGKTKCDYKEKTGWAATEYPNNADKQYYGRGPLQISWNYNYGAFSEVLQESTYNGKKYLLDNPEKVAEDALTIFSSALWFYMTPQSPKPSMHDVVTGYMQPNSFDDIDDFGPNFGTTINIINGGQECGEDADHPAKALKRVGFYKEFLDYFGLDAEAEDTLGCADQDSEFPAGGWGDDYGYWTKGSSGTKCVPSKT